VAGGSPDVARPDSGEPSGAILLRTLSVPSLPVRVLERRVEAHAQDALRRKAVQLLRLRKAVRGQAGTEVSRRFARGAFAVNSDPRWFVLPRWSDLFESRHAYSH
jgi:hypothetical protein